MGARQQKR